jgi:phytoene dehydrogenase-like protein
MEFLIDVYRGGFQFKKVLIFHYLQDDWSKMEEPYQTIFLSIPTVLDSSLAPAGRHILHVFTTAWIDDWQVN